MVTGATNKMNTIVNPQQNQAILKDVPAPNIPAPVKSDRRSNKPIMEKKRRARINNCLNELKTLILDATKKDPARHSKLEKADILEKTVKYLQELQRQQAIMQQATDPKIINKFKAGFTECANEVSRFPGLDTQLKRRLMQHLSNCINGVKTEFNQIRQQQQQQQLQHIQPQPIQHMLPSPPSSPEQDHIVHHNTQITATIPTSQIQATPNGYFLPNGVQVYPTKLANGTIALILPQEPQSQQIHQLQQSSQLPQLPMLVPIPSRTASTGSASSSSYDRINSPSINQHQTVIQHQQQQSHHHYAPPSPANSYEAMDYQQINQHQSVIHHASSSSHRIEIPMGYSNQYHHQQQKQYEIEQGPLSLVMKKINKDEEQPWRPW